MFDYTFNQAPLKMGEYDEKFGQSYWSSVNEQLHPVKFNTMQRENVTISDKISAEERVEKKSAKGTVYHQLKKVKVIKGDPQIIPETEIIAAQATSDLSRLEKKIDHLQETVNRLLPPDELDY